jgi:hypothetical protein
VLAVASDDDLRAAGAIDPGLEDVATDVAHSPAA